VDPQKVIFLPQNRNLEYIKTCELLGGRLVEGVWAFRAMLHDIVEQVRVMWSSPLVPVDIELREDWQTRDPSFLGYQIVFHNFDELERTGKRKIRVELNPDIAYISIRYDALVVKRQKTMRLYQGSRFRLEIPGKIFEMLEDAERSRWVVRVGEEKAEVSVEELLDACDGLGFNTSNPLSKDWARAGMSKRERALGMRRFLATADPARKQAMLVHINRTLAQVRDMGRVGK
jgi:hypothetical protein